MVINTYSTAFTGGNDDEWQKLWSFPYIWSESDLASYINFFRDPTLSDKDINLFIRNYMRLISNFKIDLTYSEFMKDFLGL